MDKHIQIKKAKIIDGIHLELEYRETEADGDSSVSTDIKALFRKRVHEDLINAFDKLKVHLAFLAEFMEPADKFIFDTDDVFQDEKFVKFKVNQFSLGGDDEHAGVTITGQKKLRGKKVLNINTPFVKFEYQDGIDNYDFLSQLYDHVQRCVTEVELYLGGKHAPDPQLDIFEDDDPRKIVKNMADDLNAKGVKVSVSDLYSILFKSK